jgi:hypothetical protein
MFHMTDVAPACHGDTTYTTHNAFIAGEPFTKTKIDIAMMVAIARLLAGSVAAIAAFS